MLGRELERRCGGRGRESGRRLGGQARGRVKERIELGWCPLETGCMGVEMRLALDGRRSNGLGNWAARGRIRSLVNDCQ